MREKQMHKQKSKCGAEVSWQWELTVQSNLLSVIDASVPDTGVAVGCRCYSVHTPLGEGKEYILTQIFE